jgi:hypothetical protein
MYIHVKCHNIAVFNKWRRAIQKTDPVTRGSWKPWEIRRGLLGTFQGHRVSGLLLDIFQWVAGQIGPKQNRPQVKSAQIKSAQVKLAPVKSAPVLIE